MDNNELQKIEELEKKYFQALKSAIENNTSLIEERLDFINLNKSIGKIS